MRRAAPPSPANPTPSDPSVRQDDLEAELQFAPLAHVGREPAVGLPLGGQIAPDLLAHEVGAGADERRRVGKVEHPRVGLVGDDDPAALVLGHNAVLKVGDERAQERAIEVLQGVLIIPNPDDERVCKFVFVGQTPTRRAAGTGR